MEIKQDIAPEICARDYKSPECIVEIGGAWGFDPGATRDVGDLFIKETAKTLAPGSCPGFHDGVVITKGCEQMNCEECNKECELVVRRLMPIECGRLQGMPDFWCEDIAIENPTDEEVAYWLDAWNLWQDINGKPHKNEKFIRKWLKKPSSDSAIYKMWGNGMALPNCLYVLEGIKEVADAGN